MRIPNHENYLEDSRKGKDMTTVRFAQNMNSERLYKSLGATKCGKWSVCACSYKIRKSKE